MNAATERLVLAGPAGAIDAALDRPAGPGLGIAVIAHPHPLFGGTRDNKVVQTLARALLDLGFACWRPNFRGVGGTHGAHDEGRGETEDLLAVVEAARGHPSAPADPRAQLVLAGFSFGGYVQTRVAGRLPTAAGPTAGLVLVAPAVTRFAAEAVPENTVLIHGEQDDVVPLGAVLDWARPQSLPIVVLPGAGHFFHGQLPLLRRVVRDAVAARLSRLPDDRAAPL